MYGDADGQKWGYAIQSKGGGYILSGRKRYANDNYAGYIIKTDSAGNIKWEKFYDRGPAFDGFKRIRQLPDGNYIAAGNTQHHDSVTLRNSSGWLLKLDTAGNTIWEKTYTYHGGDTSQDYVEDINLTTDGGFIICGWVFINGQKNDLWLFKTDSMGCVDTSCLITGIKEKIIINIQQPIIQIYPNPVSNEAFIHYILADNVENAIGEIIKEYKLNNTSGVIVMNIAYLKQGLYIAKLTDNKSFVNVRKMIIK